MVFKCANTVAGGHGAHSGTWGKSFSSKNINRRRRLMATLEWSHLREFNCWRVSFSNFALIPFRVNRTSGEPQCARQPRNAFSVLHLTTRTRSNCWTIYYSRYSPFWLCIFPSVLLWTPFSVKLWGWECWARVGINTQVQTSSCSFQTWWLSWYFMLCWFCLCTYVCVWVNECICVFICFFALHVRN